MDLTRMRFNRMRCIMKKEISDVNLIRFNRIRFLIETNDDPAMTNHEATRTTRHYNQHSREVQLVRSLHDTLQRAPCAASSAKFLKSV